MKSESQSQNPTRIRQQITNNPTNKSNKIRILEMFEKIGQIHTFRRKPRKLVKRSQEIETNPSSPHGLTRNLKFMGEFWPDLAKGAASSWFLGFGSERDLRELGKN